jgi:hypothetical protein
MNILLSDYGGPTTDWHRPHRGGLRRRPGVHRIAVLQRPRVLNGRPPTPQSDIYGLAAALFSIIAGRAAFERREGEEIIAQFLRITGQPIPDLRGHGVPDELCAVLERAMAKDPSSRPASAEAFGHDLQEVQRAAGLPVAEMALPVGRRPTDRDATAVSTPTALPRRTSNPCPSRAAVGGHPGRGRFRRAPPSSARGGPHRPVSGDPRPSGLDAAGEHADGLPRRFRQADDGATAFIDKRGPTPSPPGRLGGSTLGRLRRLRRIDHTAARQTVVRHVPVRTGTASAAPAALGARGAAPTAGDAGQAASRRPLIAIVTIVVLLASLVVVGVLVLRRPGTTPPAAAGHAGGARERGGAAPTPPRANRSHDRRRRHGLGDR